jgi:hypothetical protein
MSPSPHPLGKKRMAFWDRPLRRKELLTWFLPGLLAVAAPTAYGISRYQYGLTRYGPAAAEAWSRLWFLVAAGLAAVLAGVVIYRLFRSRHGLTIHEHGVVLRRAPLKARMLRWTELAGIAFSQTQPHFFKRPLAAQSQAVLIPQVGRPIRLRAGMEGLPQLVEHLKAGLYPHLAPSLEEAFHSEQWVYFGPAAIHCSGLRLHGVEARWEAVERVSVRAGRLVVELRQGSRSKSPLAAPVAHIPNLELLLNLIPKEAPGESLPG